MSRSPDMPASKKNDGNSEDIEFCISDDNSDGKELQY